MPSTIDPRCPSRSDSSIPGTLRALGYIDLGLSIVGAIGVVLVFGQTEIVISPPGGLGIPLTETATNWWAGVIGAGLILQGMLAWAVLSALASIVEDVTALRITAKTAAQHIVYT